MKQGDTTTEQMMLRCFPFALKGAARDWLHYLPAGSITNWTEMKKTFLEKYYPASRASYLKKQISNIEQEDEERLYEYWERFKKTCASCPYHGFSNLDLILYFTNGLGREYARMIVSACGGDIQNKTIAQAQSIIEDLAASSRHFRTKTKGISSMENATRDKETVSELKELRMMMKEMMRERGKAQVCGVCDSQTHFTMECPHQIPENGEFVVLKLQLPNYQPSK